jgi:phosphoribosylformylglycinamidine cyclo-ligase
MSQTTYKDAGVDLELYQQSMQRLPHLMRKTHSARVIDLPGGFAGLFRLNSKRRLFGGDYRDPVLVSGTDGVGTKIKVAIQAEKYDTVGIDLVAMCVNDCLCLGAEPLFFLDYLALGKDNPELIAQLVSGISDGCLQGEMALLGGETAIMPDSDVVGDFDMAGFCVGVVERKKIIDGKAIRPGDVVLGLASNGLHSNGYSLVRKVVFEMAGLGIDDHVDELGGTVGEALLKPTRIYVRPVTDVLNHYRRKIVVRGMAHITGGGLAENIERILPENCSVQIKQGSWDVPPVFDWLQRLGNIDPDEMDRVFNMGVGFALIFDPFYTESVQCQLRTRNIDSWIIGEVTNGEKGVQYVT